ncbi:uncharacterized protein LOC131624940 [Vicia villosa]|uniref:uncharacterized protein LOC131624940 n=1 Tax=Vicia villosa TaxID=3911 RepID=UPI00273CC1B5|nr:uncharacterized protein LOC131624940 [Vicia villosa]
MEDDEIKAHTPYIDGSLHECLALTTDHMPRPKKPSIKFKELPKNMRSEFLDKELKRPVIVNDMMFVPWLKKLLSITTFFTLCEVHPNVPKNECNMFCLDCNDNPFCGSCITSGHKDHNVIQIRRSSYNDAVRTTDIYKFVDILGIQTYMINNSTIVFINKRDRSHPKRNNVSNFGYMSDSLCKICKRNLVDPTYFCSLECKFAWIEKEGGFFVSAKEKKELEFLLEKSIKVIPPKGKTKNMGEHNSKRKLEEAGIEEDNDQEEENQEEDEKDVKEDENNKENVVLINHPPTSKRKPNSRRKGIPRRAPFF